MPVNYNLLTNELAYQGLADLSVLVEDTSSDSPDYFRVSKLPKEFTAGKNTFHFKGNPAIFNEGSYVYIEILDSNGQPLYYETALDLESTDQSAIVTVYVKQNTAPGTAYITLCSTIRKDIRGNFLDTSQINLRWTAPVYVNASKRSDAEIIFDVLPNITVNASTSAYTNLSYPSGDRFQSASLGNLTYYYKNNTAVIVTASNAIVGFDTDAISGNVSIYSSALTDTNPGKFGTISDAIYSSSFTVSNTGIIVLDSPISLTVANSISKFEPVSANINLASVVYEITASGTPQVTENSNNLATVFFSNLDPQTGEVAKIRSYYRSAGIGEYILSNETDITDQAPEYGFNADVISASFFLPTIQRNDRLDFKFEFVNPAGLASKQVIESKNNLFLGGNTYIDGDDNLLTGSLFVAGNTGTGVHISGKGNASMIRSIGYTGFANANSGFVMYSGSIQSLLGASENYSGVGLELYANTSSYFKYTTAGSGLLDIRSSKFFVGNNNVFLSSSNNNLEILNTTGTKTKFHLDINGNVTASAFVAITGSSDTSYEYMMNTAVGLTDGKNIGRIIYHQTDPITVTSASSAILNTRTIQTWTQSYNATNAAKAINSGSVIAPMSDTWLKYQPIVSDLSYYSLPFENTITVLGNVYVDKYSDGNSSYDVNLVLALKFTVWRPITGSYDSFGLSGNVASASGDYGFIGGISGSLSSGTQVGYSLAVPSLATLPYSANSGSITQAIPLKAAINIPSGSQDTLNVVDLDYTFFKMYTPYSSGGSPVTGSDFTFRAKFANFSVMSSRTLASSASSGHNLTVQYYDSNPGL